MKQLLILLLFIQWGGNSFSQKNIIDVNRIDKYLNFLHQVEVSAKDYVLRLFQEYDLVILAERYHAEETQYELINDIIKDEYFVSHVGNIAIEIGSSNMSGSLDTFLKTFDGDLTNGQQTLLEFQRNISFYPLWNKVSYSIFLSNLLALNQNLDTGDKVNLYLCDREFDWNTIKTKQDWENAINDHRDSIMAQNISKHFNEIQKSSRKKMLVILNEAHAIPKIGWVDLWQKRAAQYLTEKFGQKRIASVLINSVTTDENNADILVQNGYWDAAFSMAGKTNIGFGFVDSPFGQDRFDYAAGKNNNAFFYKDIFTGFVFYKPLEQHKLSMGVNNIIDQGFREEFLRRIKVYSGKNTTSS